MNLDVRLPIGGMFTIIGLIVTGFGAATSGSDIYSRSLSININLWWGVVLFAFGAIMLYFGWRGYRRGKAAPPPVHEGEAPGTHGN